jgi:hypothetical protein
MENAGENFITQGKRSLLPQGVNQESMGIPIAIIRITA